MPMDLVLTPSDSRFYRVTLTASQRTDCSRGGGDKGVTGGAGTVLQAEKTAASNWKQLFAGSLIRFSNY